MHVSDPFDYHALAIAFDLASEPFDHRHRPMTFGFAHSPDGVVWHATQPGRPLHHFQKIRVGIRSFFFVHVFSNEVIDGNHPQGLIVSARPSIEAVVNGKNHQGPFQGGSNIPFSARDLSGPIEGVRSPALDDQEFRTMWHTPQIPFLPMETSQVLSFEVLVELRIQVEGRAFDFKIDPELVIEGDFKDP